MEIKGIILIHFKEYVMCLTHFCTGHTHNSCYVKILFKIMYVKICKFNFMLFFYDFANMELSNAEMIN